MSDEKKLTADEKMFWGAAAIAALQALVHKAPLLDAEGEHGPKFDKVTLTQFRRDMATSACDYADALLTARRERGQQ